MKADHLCTSNLILRGFWMRHILLLLAMAAMAIPLPVRADQPITLSICAKGDATVYVASVIHVQSLLFGNSYQAVGWYRVDPGECKVVYNSNDANGNSVYVGVAYNDSNGVLRSDGPRPGQNGPSYWENFCVQPGVAFHYKAATKEDAQKCKPGFILADFMQRYDPPSNRYGNVDISVSPMLSDTSGRALTIQPMTARLIFGDEVHLDKGGQWRDANGVALPDSLIDPKTGLPPLLPKAQYSHTTAPVAGYLQQIKDAMNSFQTCSGGFPRSQISSSRFDMDDYGIVSEAHTNTFNLTDGPRVINSGEGAAIANLDLQNPNIIDQGPGCLNVSFACKNGPCVRSGNDRDVYWAIYVNTREQANSAINALRAIAPFYPDGTGDINQAR